MSSTKPVYILDDDLQYSALLHKVAGKVCPEAISETSATAFLNMDLPEEYVLVLDLMMPEMDGIEVIRSLAQKPQQPALILVSGFDERVLHSAQQLAEAHGIVVLASYTKPINIAEFAKLLPILIQQQAKPKYISNSTEMGVEALQEAIQSDCLRLHYQPQMSLSSNDILGFEALVRLELEDGQLLYPDRFISVAEENGLMGILTEQVLRVACRDISLNRDFFKSKHVAVNISAQNIEDLAFPELLESITTIYDVEPKQVCLELTETEVMRELTSSLDVLNRLRMKGFSLSIDDFGTGFSSLSQLYNAPFSELKIDQHFIMRMCDDNEARVIVEICIMLGKMLGMSVIAEGVENEEIMQQLRELNCDNIQGYGLSRPQDLSKIQSWHQDFLEQKNN